MHFLHLGGLHDLACTCVSLPMPLCTHCVCLGKGCCSAAAGMAPGCTPQVCSQDWDRCDSVFLFFFFCTLLFLNFLHLVCKAASPAQHRAGELWAGIPCTAGCQPHGQADRKSQRAVQPAPTPTDIQTAQASSSLCSQPASAAFYFTRKCHALTQSWMLWG